MKRIMTVTAALAVALLSAQAGAGVMRWQVTGMEGSASRYVMAGRLRHMERPQSGASALWSGWGVPGTAMYVMRRELWQHLQWWLVAHGRVAAGETAVPSYRDLISSGYISVNTIGMPECMGNNSK